MSWKSRKWSIRGFAFFLLFMAICYLVAKGIYANKMIRVKVEEPIMSSITHKIEAYGVLKGGQEFGVYVPEGLRVATVYVHVGEEFDADTPLFLIDTEDLQSKITEMEIEIHNLENECDLEKRQNAVSSINLSRANENYNITLQASDLEINRRREDLQNAIAALEEFDKEPGTNVSVSGGDNVVDAESHESTRMQLQNAVNNANRLLEDAILTKESNLLYSERNIEDAKNEIHSEKSGTNLLLDYKKRNLKVLNELYSVKGEVTAKEAGIVTDINVGVGLRTADMACCTYARTESKKYLEIFLEKDVAKYLDLGCIATLSFLCDGKEQEIEMPVNYIGKEEDGVSKVSFYLEQEGLLIGQTIKFQVKKQSETFSKCINKKGLYVTDSDKGDIFILKEQEGFFGKEFYVQKVNVKIVDSNDDLAAIECSNLGTDDCIVVDASDALFDGAVVRLEAQ